MTSSTNKNAIAHQVCHCVRCKSMYRFVDRLFEHQPGDYQIKTLDHWFGITISHDVIKELTGEQRDSLFLLYSDLKLHLYDTWLAYTLIRKFEGYEI